MLSKTIVTIPFWAMLLHCVDLRCSLLSYTASSELYAAPHWVTVWPTYTVLWCWKICWCRNQTVPEQEDSVQYRSEKTYARMTTPAASASMPMPSYAVNEHCGAGNSIRLSLDEHFADIAKTLSASLFNDDLLPKCSDFKMLIDEDATSTNRNAYKSHPPPPSAQDNQTWGK